MSETSNDLKTIARPFAMHFAAGFERVPDQGGFNHNREDTWNQSVICYLQ